MAVGYPQERCWLHDRWGSGSWYDISAWTSKIPVSENPRAAGQTPTVAIQVYTFQPGPRTPLPVQIVGGQEIIYYAQDFYGPNLHNYHVAGKVGTTKSIALPEGSGLTVTVIGFERELNAVVNYLAFTDTAYQYDTSRIQYLLETSGLLQGTWDGTTAVKGPFVNYAGTGTTPYYRTTVIKIIRAIAQTAPNVGSNVTYRQIHVTGRWSNPAAPGTGTIVRVLNYYDPLTGTQAPLTLTDKADGTANLVRATFSGLDAIGLRNADSGHVFETQLGTFGTLAGTAYMQAVSTSEGIAVADSGRADVAAQVAFSTIQNDQKLVFRVVTNGAWSYRWEGFALNKGSGGNYGLYRYQGGAFTLLGTIAVTPANGDIIQAVTSGSTITIFINGIQRLQVTSTFNQTATKHGIGATTIGAARWDNLFITGKGNTYYNPERTEDYSGLVNIVAINGPQSDPIPVEWDTATAVNVSTSSGRVIKTDVNGWQASTPYTVGTYVRPVANPNGGHYKCTTGGTSGATEPGSWPATEGGTVVDGSVTWTRDTWNAGVLSTEVITDDGGYVTTEITETKLASDDFNRPNGPPDKTDDGKTWTVVNGGPWSIESGLLKGADNSAGTLIVDAGVGGAAIVEGRFAIGAAGARLTFRLLDQQNQWYVQWNASNWTVVKRVANVDTTVYTLSEIPVNGHTIKVVLADNTIQLYKNGAFKTTITDSWLQGATKHGFSLGGTAYLTARFDNFRVWQTYSDKAIGLGIGNTGQSWTDIDFGIKFSGATRQAQACENGSLLGPVQTVTIGDTFKIEARRESSGLMQVVYYRAVAGGVFVPFYVSLQNPNPTAAAPFHVDTALYHVGAVLATVTARRFTYGIYRDTVSIARYGAWPAPEIITDDALDTNAKRQDRANGIFARYAYPRDTLIVLCLTEYQVGVRVPVDNARLGWLAVVRVIAAVEVLHTSSVGKAYQITLGDSPIEYGDNEPLGYLLRAPDRDATSPNPPIGFTYGATFRDGPNTASQELLWQVPTGDEQSIIIRLEAPGYQPIVRAARAGRAVIPFLPANTLFRATSTYRDYNNNEGRPSPAIEFTTAPITLLQAPAWASPALPRQGVNPDGVYGWQEISYTLVPGAYQYMATYWRPTVKGGGIGPTYVRFVSHPASLMSLLNVSIGVAYNVTVTAIDAFGIPGYESTAQPFTVAPAPSRDVGILGADNAPPDAGPGEVMDWRVISGSATLDKVNSPYRRGKTSYKITNGGSIGTIVIEQNPIPVIAGGWYYGWASYYPVNGAAGSNTITDEVAFYDAAGTLQGTGSFASYDPAALGLLNQWKDFPRGPLVMPSIAGGSSYDCAYIGRRVRWINAPASGVMYFSPPLYGESSLAEYTGFQLGNPGLLFYDPASPGTTVASFDKLTAKIRLTGITSGGNNDFELGGRDIILTPQTGRRVYFGGLTNYGAFLTSDPASPSDGDIWPITAGGLTWLKGRAGSTTLDLTVPRIASMPAAGTAGRVAILTGSGQGVDGGLFLYDDGTRWLGHERSLPFLPYPGWAAEIAGDTELYYVPLRTDRVIYLVRWVIYGFVNGTNNSTNYWTITLRTFTGLSTCAAVDTKLWGAGAWPGTVTEVTSFSQPGGSDQGLEVIATKTLSPGLLRFTMALWVRPIYPTGAAKLPAPVRATRARNTAR